MAVGLVALVLLAFGGGCPDDEADDGTKPQTAEPLPSLTLADDTEDLLLTWIDDRGETHTEVAIADVPDEGDELVRVIVTDRSEGHGARFYVADLSTKRPDGTYPVRTMTRAEWERIIAQRRRAYLAKVAPPPPTAARSGAADGEPAPSAVHGRPVAIVYGAEWCGPCHQAQAYLKKHGVRVIYRDVDREPKARAEMQRKLHRAGRAGSSIPVIDVGGQILVGYSPPALDAAIERAGQGTAL